MKIIHEAHVHAMKTESCHDANFVFIGGCCYDNL